MNGKEILVDTNIILYDGIKLTAHQKRSIPLPHPYNP
jgi:hypothetical protein